MFSIDGDAPQLAPTDLDLDQNLSQPSLMSEVPFAAAGLGDPVPSMPFADQGAPAFFDQVADPIFAAPPDLATALGTETHPLADLGPALRHDYATDSISFGAGAGPCTWCSGTGIQHWPSGTPVKCEHCAGTGLGPQ